LLGVRIDLNLCRLDQLEERNVLILLTHLLEPFRFLNCFLTAIECCKLEIAFHFFEDGRKYLSVHLVGLLLFGVKDIEKQ